MPVKVTLFMEIEKTSWSETHYWLTGSDLSSSSGPARDLASVRGACLGVGAALIGIRLSTVPSSRMVTDVDIGEIRTTGVWPADPTGLVEATDRPYSSLLVRLKGTVSNKNYYMAGVPDGCIRTVPGSFKGFQLSQDFTQVYLALMEVLTNGQSGGQWGFRSRVASFVQPSIGLVTNAAFPQTIGVQTPQQLMVQAGVQQAPVAVGQEVYLTGWRRINTRSPGLAGAWQVVGILAPVAPAVAWTYFLGESGNVETTNFLGMGSIGGLTFQYLPYIDFEARKSTSRKRGGSYGRSVGKSRTRR